MTTTTVPDLMDADAINAAHRQEWRDAVVALDLDPDDHENYYKVPRDIGNEIAERTRKRFERLIKGGDGVDLEGEHRRRSDNYNKAFAWVKQNLGAIATFKDHAASADVPESAMRSVEEKNPAWFRALGGKGIYQIVNGERQAQPKEQSASEAAAAVAAMMAKLTGH